MFTYAIPNYGGNPRSSPTAAPEPRVLQVKAFDLDLIPSGVHPVKAFDENGTAILRLDAEDAEEAAPPNPESTPTVQAPIPAPLSGAIDQYLRPTEINQHLAVPVFAQRVSTGG